MSNDGSDVLAQSPSNPTLLKTVRYEDTLPRPPSSPNQNNAKRPKTSPTSTPTSFKFRSPFSKIPKRNSGVSSAPSTPTESTATAEVDLAANIPKITVEGSTASLPIEWDSIDASATLLKADGGAGVVGGGAGLEAKHRISMDIPSGDLFGLDTLEQVSFSNRGSILLRGKKASEVLNGHVRMSNGRRQLSAAKLAQARPETNRVLSTDDEMLSQKVRSMYEHADARYSSQRNSQNLDNPRGGALGGPITEETGHEAVGGRRSMGERPAAFSTCNGDTPNGWTPSSFSKDEYERAGGIEDWEDVDGRDVDRYGFIVPRKASSRSSSSLSNGRARSPERPRPQRVSTLLQLASDAPRRKGSFRRKPSTNTKRTRDKGQRTSTEKASPRSLRPPASLNSDQPSVTRSPPRRPFRNAANRLPGNKNRRCVDEAGDMLTLPPGLADIEEEEDGGKAAMQLKRKEWDRAEKWTKMAKVVDKRRNGKGMAFTFDTQDPKLITRTWKGIPDRWRATAWHAFLSHSAKKRQNCVSDEELIEEYHDLVEHGSADDVQIDIDVPRTINSHIMFRKRYRGGQRLLFRVLHSLSLYFPETGYVQGMASLAATLLCYYDEDMTFVMLVRLWQVRGLQRLYASGFAGLMDALGEFEKHWLVGGDVAKKLESYNIDPTAYGTRWYLTLFNYSIPFPAQLRVWDVFMLLGDPTPGVDTPFQGSLDVLHATSAALIDATRAILLDSDFENAMKVLTSWMPIKDEELLMRVARAEWKMRRKR
ncbi:MAG: hypothetical protein M1833_002695 [Piccolia ochrophora]|nr:MAG: hypothetical protein M1833_002695 [Piccolia ochrophora]